MKRNFQRIFRSDRGVKMRIIIKQDNGAEFTVNTKKYKEFRLIYNDDAKRKPCLYFICVKNNNHINGYCYEPVCDGYDNKVSVCRKIMDEVKQNKDNPAYILSLTSLDNKEIKSESRTIVNIKERPYVSADEMRNDIKERFNSTLFYVKRKQSGIIYMVLAVDWCDDTHPVKICEGWLDMKGLYNDYEYIDGSVIGIKEEVSSTVYSAVL